MRQVSLTDRDVWIIDDAIPITRWEFADDDLLTGTRPIDRGTLLTLVHFADWWDDGPLRVLCEQLVRKAGCVTAFTHPSSAIQHLDRGAPIPDVVVFDLDYRFSAVGARRPLELLKQMLGRCVSVVQVYTNTDVEEASRLLKPLRRQYQTRLEAPQYKADTDAEQLMRVMKDRLARSLSAHLARRIRRSSSVAVEDVLTRIDDLPLNVAVRLLAGRAETPEELELVELLSVKVGEALESAPKLAAVVEEFVTDREVPAERVKETVREIVALLASNVRERVLYDGGLFAAIKSAWEAIEQGEENRDETETEGIVQEFFAFRLYDHPNDDLVRTGDIILLPSSEDASQDASPDLYLVLTPPCDLAHFWYRTRGVLTLARMYPMTKERGIQRVRSYANPKPNRIESITARHPMVFPSVPLSKNEREDYALFVYEIRYLEFDGSALWKQNEGISKKKRFSCPLTYQELRELGVNTHRKCRVSEPFLSGVLAELGDHLFRPGVPDFPDEERERLKGLFD
jgi:hypothetical protein